MAGEVDYYDVQAMIRDANLELERRLEREVQRVAGELERRIDAVAHDIARDSLRTDVRGVTIGNRERSVSG